MGWGEPQEPWSGKAAAEYGHGTRISPQLDPWMKLEQVERMLQSEKAYSGELYKEIRELRERIPQLEGTIADMRTQANNDGALVKTMERVLNREHEALEELSRELIFFRGF